MRHLLILLILVSLSIQSKESTIKLEFDKILSEIEFNKELSRRELIINSIIQIESENNNFARNGDNIGILQIRPIMVYEINRILGYKKYELRDRFDSIKSIEMFKIYTNHHTPDWNLELVARRWNGGYNGEYKKKTLSYYLKIKNHGNKETKD
jgi:hypothetical protein